MASPVGNERRNPIGVPSKVNSANSGKTNQGEDVTQFNGTEIKISSIIGKDHNKQFLSSPKFESFSEIGQGNWFMRPTVDEPQPRASRQHFLLFQSGKKTF